MPKRKPPTAGLSPAQMADLAAPVSARVQIEQVILAETTARRRPLFAKPPAELSLAVTVETKTLKEDRVVQVFPRFTLIGRDGPGGAEEMLRIEALFVIRYRVATLDGITEENIDAFGKMNGIYNVWPYWREFVQSMTVRMGLPPLTMPVYGPLQGGIAQQSEKDAPKKLASQSAGQDAKSTQPVRRRRHPG